MKFDLSPHIYLQQNSIKVKVKLPLLIYRLFLSLSLYFSYKAQPFHFNIVITNLRYILWIYTVQKVLAGNLMSSFTKAMSVISPFPFHLDLSKRSISLCRFSFVTQELLCNFAKIARCRCN